MTLSPRKKQISTLQNTIDKIPKKDLVFIMRNCNA